MPKATVVQTNGTAGELSPRLLGRSDLSKYSNGFQRLENFIVQKHGGVIRRSGTRFVAEAKDSAAGTDRLAILIEFQFSVTQTYILEFGHLYIRFYRDKAQVKQVAGDPSPGTITEIASPYTDAQLRDIAFTQSADILYIQHPSHEVRELQRGPGADTDPATWTLAEFNSKDGPYLSVNTTATTLSPSGTTGPVTITAVGTAGINGGDGFKSTDVGRVMRLSNPASATAYGWGTITAFTDTTHVDVAVDADNPFSQAGVATTTWRLGAWSDTTGWPHTAVFHQERLWFGGEPPQTLHASRVGDFNNFSPSGNDDVVLADSGLAFTISSDRVDAIRSLTSDAEGLLVLTEGGTFLARSAGGAQDAITPLSFGVTRQHTFGSHEKVQPHQVASTALSVTSDGRKVREQVFRFDDNRFVAPDLTILAEHITVGGVVDSAYQQEPDSVFWLVRADGVLLGLTYERTEEVVGWHRHIIGGSLTGSSNAEVESIAVIRRGDDDLLWLVVKRTINGSTKRYVEFMEIQFAVDAKLEDGFFVDSGLSYDGVATKLLTGLDHLEGETVEVLADGARHGPQLVTGGSILLTVAANKAHVGLGFTSRLKTMPLIAPGMALDPRAKRQRVYKLLVDFHNTLGGRMGTDSQLDVLDYRTPSDPMDSPPPIFTGIKELSFPGGWTRQPTVSVESTVPQPMTILNIVAEMIVGGV